MSRFFDITSKNVALRMLAVIVLLAAALDVGFYFFKIRPVGNEEAEILLKSGGVNRDRGAIEKEIKLYSDFDAAKAGLDGFRKMLPTRAEYPRIVKRVYKMVSDNKLTASTLAVESKTSKIMPDLLELDISIPVRGQYKDVRNFLKSIETTDMLIMIDSMGFNSSEQSEDLSMTITLSTYMRIQK